MEFKDVNKKEEPKGIKFWKNPKNNAYVFMLHYTADPDKDPDRNGKEWFKNEQIGTPKYLWQKEYEIDFSTKSGKLIYGAEFCDLDPKVHFINSFELDEPYELLLSVDFGQRNPTAALVGAWTPDNRLFIIDEYYKPGLPSRTSNDFFQQFGYLMGQDTKGLSLRAKKDLANRTFQIKVIDPTVRAKNRTKIKFGDEIEYSVLEEFEDNGWEFELGNNDVASGINRVREYFKIDGNGDSRLYIFRDKCPKLCWELEHYKYQELTEVQAKNRNASEEPVKKNDHAVDALRYLIVTRPVNPETAPRPLTKVQKHIQSLIKPKAFNSDWDLT